MARYSKSYSNYVLKKRHKTLDDGSTIFERDWGTLGERHVIEQGKRRVYSDSGFLFTDNTISGHKYRNNTGEWSAPYTQDDLGDKIDTTVNNTSILAESNDIRDYAYYGSAVELLRVSVENIVKWFPGRFWSTDDFIMRYNDNGMWEHINNIITDGHHNYAIEWTFDQSSSVYLIKNPFTIDFYNKNVVFGKYDNTLRNMPMSFKQYTLRNYNIKTWDVWAKPYTGCEENYTIKYDIKFTYGDDSLTMPGHLYGLKVDDSVVWCTTVEHLVAQPKKEIIEKYFTELKGFEAKLLNRTNKPRYTSKLITPIPYGNNNPNYLYIERSYTWPSEDYCISVDSVAFGNYYNSLYQLAVKMDELWCDNLWRNMTHEPITNFDWTYTKEYNEGDEVDNILGGTRMEGILRIWGRCFDDIKRYIDGISLKNCITYDYGVSNLANAELSDKAELLGWDVYSTKLNKDDNLYLTNNFVEEYLDRWYNTRNPEAVSQNVVDNDFMKRLVLSTGEIFRTKGTKHAIEMVFGLFGIGNHDEDNPDFEFEEKYYTVFPRKRDELFCYYVQVPLPESGVEYDDYGSQYDTLEAYLSENPATIQSPTNIVIDGMYYDLVQHETLGEFCEYMIGNKSAVLNYDDDEFSGTPIKDVYINNEHYIVPYFTQDRIYDGNVQFETKGGWGKLTEEYEYMETIPYMDILDNVEGLLSVNMFTVGGKKIFYVNDISGLTNYVESIPTNVSHLFKLINPANPNVFESWRNIPNDGYIDENYGIFDGLTEDDIKMAEYYYKLKFDNFGNNPHCGYGNYDLGNEYLQYIETPFKHAIENYGFINAFDDVCAKQLKFKVTEHIVNKDAKVNEKIVNTINTPQYIPYEPGTVIQVGDFYYEYEYIETFDYYEYKEKIATEEITVPSDNEQYYYIEYILPSKVLKIKNNIDNNCYKAYLKEIVLKYVTQVIPSTTILILENFEGDGCEPEPPAPVGGYYYFTSRINRLPSNFSINDCTPFSEFPVMVENGIKDLTIIIIPEAMAATLRYVSDGITSAVTECDEQQCLVRIDDSYVNGLPLGYKVLQYYVPNISTESAEILLQFTDSSYYYTINGTQLPNNFSINNCTPFNETSVELGNGINDLTIIVVPEQRSVVLTYVSDGITSTVDECSTQDCLTRINGSYVQNIPVGYKVLQYYVPSISTTHAEITLE